MHERERERQMEPEGEAGNEPGMHDYYNCVRGKTEGERERERAIKLARP